MKNLSIFAVLTIIMATIQVASAQQMHSGLRSSSGPSYKFDFNLRLMDRDFGGSADILTDGFDGSSVLSASDAIDLSMGTGAELSYTFEGMQGNKYELRGFFDNWDNSTTRTGTDFRSPLAPDVSVAQFDTEYSAEMFSIELNRRIDVHPGFSFIAGVRYMKLSEESVHFGDGSLLVDPTIRTAFGELHEVENPLLGIQIGGIGNYFISHGIHLDWKAKAGVYSNTAKRETIAGDILFGNVVTEGSQSDATFVGEFGLRLHYDLIPNHISMFAGYEGLYLGGVALAPLQTGIASGINDNENVLLNGITLGVSMRR